MNRRDFKELARDSMIIVFGSVVGVLVAILLQPPGCRP